MEYDRVRLAGSLWEVELTSAGAFLRRIARAHDIGTIKEIRIMALAIVVDDGNVAGVLARRGEDTPSDAGRGAARATAHHYRRQWQQQC